MIVLDTQGIVLRAVKYRDKDLILTIFTRKYGKVSAIAKGAQGQKSRFLSASQLFSYNNYNLALPRNFAKSKSFLENS